MSTEYSLEIPKANIVELTKNDWVDLPKRMGDRRNTPHLCEIEWSWSPAHSMTISFFLQRGRTHWILWQRYYDGNSYKWDKPAPVVRCLRKDLGEHEAALRLLTAALSELRHSREDPDRFDFVFNAGSVCSEDEIHALGDTVWPETEAPDVAL